VAFKADYFVYAELFFLVIVLDALFLRSFLVCLHLQLSSCQSSYVICLSSWL